MHRFHVPPAECGEATITLAGGDAHHALHVLRLRAGDAAVVLDGAGHEYHCEVSHLTRKTIDLAVRQKKSKPRSTCEITLVQAVPKGKLFDSIVQKATELGISRVVPLLTERVVRQFDDEKSESKLEHWQAIAVESIKQCGSPWLPRIDAPIPVSDFLDCKEEFDLSLIASLEADSRHPKEWFRSFRERTAKLNPESICVWVGPEGDFTPAELAAAKAAGALPITLGRLVLRSETAAIYCLSVLNYEIQGAAN
jgi:16S rRNA (uracil1498-N3)-methyltransferase